jgi:branched-chain amino acid transport system permease protein
MLLMRDVTHKPVKQKKAGRNEGGRGCQRRWMISSWLTSPSVRMSDLQQNLMLALQAIFSGVLVGGVYGILSVGLSLAFGVMRIVNFAHGELVMYGMFAGVIASKMFGIDPLIILPLSFLFTAVVGMAQYRIVFRHFVGHATLNQLLAAIGCAFVLQMIAQLIFGADARTAQSIFTGKYTVIGPFFLSQAQIVAFIIAVVATLAVEVLLRTSTWGKAVRAVADDIEAAEIVGVNSGRINLFAFALSTGLAGLAGTVLVTYFPTAPSVGFQLMPIIIIATTIGGLGSIGGTFLGGICCGIVQQVTAMMWNSALQDVPLYLLLLLFIAFRPTGFFGSRVE